jgi:hypothetical protein
MKANVMSRHVSGEVKEGLIKQKEETFEKDRIKQAQDIEKRAWLAHPLSSHLLKQIKGLREINRDKLVDLDIEDLPIAKAREQVYKTVIKMIEE